MRHSAVAIAIIGIVLTGCAALQQEAAVRQRISCLQAVYNSPEASPLRLHESFDVSDATLAQLGDSSFASPAEVATIAAIHPRLRACQREFLARAEKIASAFVPLLAKADRDADDDTLAIMQHKMSWGEYTRRRRDRAIASREAAGVIEQRLAAENQANQAAAMQELATAAAIIQASRPVQPQATFTSCTQQGVFANCWQR